MFSQRNLPRDQDEPWRNNADEDQRGYQNYARRSEFVSADRSRPDYGRYGRMQDRDYDDAREARYGFDARDLQRREYGREYGLREFGQYNSGDNYRDDYSRTDYGNYRGGNRSQYGGQSQRGGNYGGYAGSFRSRDFGGGERDRSHDQGQMAQMEYGRSQFQRRTATGPKGYRRSDERIHEDVCDRLGHDYEIDASEVEVTVSNGEVTLAGTVNDRRQKFRVEHIADGVSGVTEVHNQLRVKRELPMQGANATPTSAQQNRTTGTTTNQNRSS
jgi:osmotically-inducible protein OsmY